MNLETAITFSTCLLVLVMSVVPVQSANNEKTNSESYAERVKRRSSYNPWSVTSRRNSVALYEASSIFKPSPYAVPRPYFIPVYGAPGRPLIFYPPQQVYLNAGTPQDNPLTSQHGGSPYLPPKESPHFPSTPPSSMVGNRNDFGDDDDAPVWSDSKEGDMVQMPLSGNQNKEPGPIPTRAPMTRPTQPPLVHDAVLPELVDGSAKAQSNVRPTKSPFMQQPGQRPTQRTTTTTSTTPAGPSNCVWAIISCCSAANPNLLPQNCFEQRGCPGPFWDASPCESDFARAAISAAVSYYNSNSSRRSSAKK